MLTPRLSSYWVHLMKPISSRVSGPLIEVLRNHVVVTGDSARELFSRIEPRDFKTVIAGRLPCNGGPLRASESAGSASPRLTKRHSPLFVIQYKRIVSGVQEAKCALK